MQRAYLEATLSYWRDHAPQSAIYGGPMVSTADMSCCRSGWIIGIVACCGEVVAALVGSEVSEGFSDGRP